MINAHMGNDFHSQMFLTVEIFCYWSGSWFCCLPCDKIKSDYINADFSQGVMITITIKFPNKFNEFSALLLLLCFVVDPKVTLRNKHTHTQLIFQGYFLVIYLNYIEIIIEKFKLQGK